MFKMKLDGKAVPQQDLALPNEDANASATAGTAAHSPDPLTKSPVAKSPKSPRVARKTPSPSKSARLSKSPRSPSISPVANKTPTLDKTLQKPADNDKTPHLPATPTTFGLENTTTIRPLRKSMHPRQIGRDSDAELSPDKSGAQRPNSTHDSTAPNENVSLNMVMLY